MKHSINLLNIKQGFDLFKRAFKIWFRYLKGEEKYSLHPEMFKTLFWGYLSNFRNDF